MAPSEQIPSSPALPKNKVLPHSEDGPIPWWAIYSDDLQQRLGRPGSSFPVLGSVTFVGAEVASPLTLLFRHAVQINRYIREGSMHIPMSRSPLPRPRMSHKSPQCLPKASSFSPGSPFDTHACSNARAHTQISPTISSMTVKVRWMLFFHSLRLHLSILM